MHTLYCDANTSGPSYPIICEELLPHQVKKIPLFFGMSAFNVANDTPALAASKELIFISNPLKLTRKKFSDKREKLQSTL